MLDRTVKVSLTPGGQIVVQFQYDKEIIKEIKKISDYRWEANAKIWTFPYRKENFFRILKIFEGRKIEVERALRLKYLSGQNENEIIAPVTQADQIISEVKKELVLRNYRHGTIKAYRSNLQKFIQYFSSHHPRDLTSEDVRNYLIHLLTEGKLAAGTLNQVINAIKFLYEEIYKKQLIINGIPRPKKEKKLPDVLNCSVSEPSGQIGGGK